jgi:hypothetical protein
MQTDRMIAILNSEMELATGCTEPAAIALAAAAAAQPLLRAGSVRSALRCARARISSRTPWRRAFRNLLYWH